jgi:hypothetical protein
MTDPLLPHLKLVHRFPQAFPRIRIDRGAIRFVLSGATLMAPGITSDGGRLPGDDGEEWGCRRRALGEGCAGGSGSGGEGGGVCRGIVDGWHEGGGGGGQGTGGGGGTFLGRWVVEVEY